MCDSMRHLSSRCVKYQSDMSCDITKGPLIRRGSGCVATGVQLKYALEQHFNCVHKRTITKQNKKYFRQVSKAEFSGNYHHFFFFKE